MTLANALTLLRLALAPFVFYAALEGRDLLVLALLASAAATDVVDGWAARKTGKVSGLGTVLDPVADKFVIAAALLGGALAHRLPLWLAGVYLAKELLQLAFGGFFLARRAGVPIPSNRYGKGATVLTFSGFFLLWLKVQAAWWLILAGLCLGLFAAGTYLFAAMTQRGANRT